MTVSDLAHTLDVTHSYVFLTVFMLSVGVLLPQYSNKHVNRVLNAGRAIGSWLTCAPRMLVGLTNHLPTPCVCTGMWTCSCGLLAVIIDDPDEIAPVILVYLGCLRLV